MRNWLMSLLAEVGKAERLEMVVGEYGSYRAYNLTPCLIRARAVLPSNAASTPERCSRTHRSAPLKEWAGSCNKSP